MVVDNLYIIRYNIKRLKSIAFKIIVKNVDILKEFCKNICLRLLTKIFKDVILQL